MVVLPGRLGRIISAASSTSILALASGWATPWWVPIGAAHTSRSRGVPAALASTYRAMPTQSAAAGDPLRVQPVEHLPEALTLDADQRRRADPDVVEVQR